MTLELTVPLLGVPFTVRSPNATMHAAAEASLARWRTLPAALIAPGPAVILELALHEPGPDAVPLPQGRLAVARHGAHWLAAGAGMLLHADLAHGQALAVLGPKLAQDTLRLSHEVIERLGLVLVEQRERSPFAAAAVVGMQRAVVLAPADPTVTLEPLLRACQRAGLALLATTTIYVGPARKPLLWGHAPLGATEAAGKVVTHAEQAALCVVTTGRGQVSRLVPLNPIVASEHLTALTPSVAQFIVAGGAQRLEVGADPEGAARLVRWLAGGT